MYLILDTETGGIGLETSLLTVSFIITDNSFEIQDVNNWSLIPDDGLYHVKAKDGGLSINKINLTELAEKAVSYRLAGQDVYKILQKWSDDGKDKLIPVGKNVSGDINQITDKLISKGSWEKFVSYRPLDLSSICQYLKIVGRIPPEVSGSLESIGQFYKIPTNELHTAEGDAILTLKCLQMMIRSFGVENS